LLPGALFCSGEQISAPKCFFGSNNLAGKCVFVCCCCSWQVQISWLAHACLDNIGLARVHALTALDICVSDASQKKHVGALQEQCSLQNTLGIEFRITLELAKFDTKSKKSVPMETLFPNCSQGNPFFHAKIDHFLFLFLYFSGTMPLFNRIKAEPPALTQKAKRTYTHTHPHLTTNRTTFLCSSFFLHHHSLNLTIIYEFKLPFGSYVETCTSFYVFSGPKQLSSWVGYWTPTQLHHHLSASHHPTPPP
jgi:hypothetical protein